MTKVWLKKPLSVLSNRFLKKNRNSVTTIVVKDNNRVFIGLTVVSLFVVFLTVKNVLAAGDVSYDWDFSNSGDYTLSDSNYVEVASNSAKLKVQNYASDANTVALYHLDEASGTTVADSSSNSNTGTATDPTWASGNLNNALDLNGTSSKVSVSDSVSLSLEQANTLEAWTKFDAAFSSGSHVQRQGVVDKGVYQLYYDNETGKLTYEVADSTETSWTRRAGNDIDGSWDLDGKVLLSSMTYLNSILYVGLGSGNGDADVWSWDGNTWEQVGGDAVNSSWAAATFESVWSMANDGTNVYVGLGTTAGDGEVWRYNVSAGTWTKIGGDAVNSSWQVNTFEGVYSLLYENGILYAGLGTSANDAEVWSWNGSTWTKIGGDSVNSGWTTNFEQVSSLETDGTYIYAGLGLTAGDAEVWRYSISGGTWSRIGGDAVNSSWANSTFEYVLSMEYFGGTLYAGVGTSANDAEVWSWNGTSWTQIGGDSLNSGWTTNYEGVYSLLNDGTYLYAGLGASGGDNELWRWGGSSWTKVGGDGVNSGYTGTTHTIVQALAVNGSTVYTGLSSGNAARSAQVWSFNGTDTWTQLGGDYVNDSWGFRGLRNVETMQVSGANLYAGLGQTNSGNALVWEYDGSTWDLIGGQGLNSGWAADTYESVLSMVSYKGTLTVGLGISANDAEVWQWNGTSWTKIGGDSTNSGWTTNFEEVTSMATYGDLLYAGLGNSNSDAEVWSWDGISWTKIGGDSTNSGWTTGYNRVASMTVFNGQLYAGLGSGAGEAEVWRWGGSTWTKVGGDTVNSSWDSTSFEHVDSMIVYNGVLYAGLGTGTGDAEVWSYNGTSWTQVGGDEVNSSWTTGTYERVRTLVVYNGDLYAGIGSGGGDGEVWRWNGSSWEQIGGDSLNDGWTNVTEEVSSFSVYRGSLFAGTGLSANVDAAVWSYGSNAYLQSTTASQNTSWHHVAATYDGSTMKLYIDGVLDNSTSASVSMPDGSHDLLIGATYAGREQGRAQGYFQGLIDEVRISDTARSSFNTSAYASAAQTVQNAAAAFTEDIGSYAGFVVSETANGGTITYRLSSDNGSTWKYWDGDSWETSASTAQANAASVVNTNIPSFPVTSSGIKWQAVLDGDGTQEVTLSSVTVEANSDTTDPNPPSSLTSLSTSGGISISTNNWYSYATPYFSWAGASDSGGAGIAGYFVYFGTDSAAVPSTAGVFQTGTSYSAASLTSGQTYYLRIQTKDNAQNVSTVYAPFIYKYDNTNPSNPSTITVTPSGYASTNSFTFSWPSVGDGIASDTGSGIAGYQYKTGASSGALSDWSSTTTDTSVEIAEAAYQTDANTFYLRTVDTAGNVSATSLQATYYFAGEGPTAPRFLSVTPTTNTVNSFSFSWQIPETYSGESSGLTYCYTVNTLPSSATCTYTSAGATSLSASSFATQVGINTFYIAAKNSSDVGGSINYGAYASISFTANTSAPGIPLNLDISDVSIKSTESWRLALSWTAPSDVGSGVSTYQIHSSTDGSSYSLLATTTGLAYIDTNLLQQNYYYKVRACDSVSNCGAFSTAVVLLPTGKFTEAAGLETDPEVTGITTKQAIISWSTDRTSDSKVQYGKSSGDYFDEEPSNSTQVTAHEINLTNLSPGTKYYALAKWTDEDGNTGVSDEFTFETEPAPSVKDPSAKTIGINNVVLQYTVKGASKVKIYYGKTSAFGGSLELSTSTAETTYNTALEELEDGIKYFYKINTFDTEDAEYEGNILSFETLPRPRISGVKVQQVRNSAQPATLVSWVTNTEVSSIITYYPENNPADVRDEVNVQLVTGAHRLIIRGLLPETTYIMIVKGRDKAGNEAVSDPQRVTTATDTRPPSITNLKVEGSITKANNNEASAQLVVSWDTDEPATSQVEFGEGTGTTYSQKSQEDSSLTYNHVVILTGLNTSKVYHLRAISKDKANNEAKSIDTVSITPKASDNALNLVISNLSETFGFLEGLNTGN
ncbi:MAG: LamG-like jellyroll fold domain-containing protein [Patescibacteria group bacterium]